MNNTDERSISIARQTIEVLEENLEEYGLNYPRNTQIEVDSEVRFTAGYTTVSLEVTIYHEWEKEIQMKVRKNPVKVEAVRWIKGSEEEVKTFMNMELVTEYLGEVLVIETLEGTVRAQQGDYIIKGVNGEFYPCKPDIFHKTYDVLEEPK